jgi:1-acyl-sn-glycerol-3-phosphate acyltransferase
VELTYTASNILQRALLRIFADWKVAGRENVPPMGPLMVVSNHLSNLDPPLLGASLPRRIRFLAKQSLFTSSAIGGWFLRNYGSFPLNRDGVDVAAYRWALNELAGGGALVLFPEGTRSRGTMTRAKQGVVNIALKTKAPILPVGITGTQHTGHWINALHPTGTIRVNVGQVFSLPDIDGRPSKELLESLTTSIMLRIAELLPESYRGVYSDLTGRTGTPLAESVEL